jgi:hypothetical protein
MFLSCIVPAVGGENITVFRGGGWARTTIAAFRHLLCLQKASRAPIP